MTCNHTDPMKCPICSELLKAKDHLMQANISMYIYNKQRRAAGNDHDQRALELSNSIAQMHYRAVELCKDRGLV